MYQPVPKDTMMEEEDEKASINLHNNCPLAFQDRWHMESPSYHDRDITQTWRMKERMKTVSVALVLCLNVGVDPPDVVKTTPCARLECWVDPLTYTPQKALEEIGNNLHKQYEKWQPRARYKKNLDPTVDDITRLCTSLRKNSKEERVLFHYNGHGVPKPTSNGEIWVFNKTYTQYIPLSIYDLQTWLGSPSIYVYDCSNAGMILNSFKNFAFQREKEAESGLNAARNCIQLAACSANELLPMNPELPADLFTACLTTPIRMALQWFCHQNHGVLMSGVTVDLIENIPGRLSDRRTPLGELNWIFTAITDTIAWNMLPRDLFQKLFRQDLLVASLFRNFLLAERIMRSYHCTPMSDPALPSTFRHPMWQAWDHAVDICLSQLPAMLEEKNYKFKYSPFFAQQLTAFQVWLSLGVSERNSPEQLPIVLQVLLSQVHRLRALDLLGKFLDLGPWAVLLALSVGIFPYVLKLLQSLAKELKPLLVFIWAKILAVDSACQTDLVKDDGHLYFLKVLQDPTMNPETRTMAAFVLAEIVKGYLPGQEACLQSNIITVCLDQLDDAGVSTPQLSQWIAICLGYVWLNYDGARWRGVRDSAHERLYELLESPTPEVRAAAIFSLGTFINNQPEAGSDHAMTIDHSVGSALLQISHVEGSPMVRCELTSALQKFVSCYDSSVCSIALKYFEEEQNMNKLNDTDNQPSSSFSSPSGPKSRLTASLSSASLLSTPSSRRSLYLSPANTPVKATQSASSATPSTPASKDFLNSLNITMERLNKLRQLSLANLPKNSGILYNSIYNNVWKALLQLSVDPFPDVSELATNVIKNIMDKIVAINQLNALKPPSTPGSPKFGRSARSLSDRSSTSSLSPHKEGNSSLTPYARQRKMFQKAPEINRVVSTELSPQYQMQERVITTDFCEWSSSAFSRPISNVLPHEQDEKKDSRIKSQFNKIQDEIIKANEYYDPSRLSEQQFQLKNYQVPNCLQFHPHNNTLLVADKSEISIWDWEKSNRKYGIANGNPSTSSITSLDFINKHDYPLILAGCDDGSVRIWRDCPEEENISPRLVSAWKAIPERVPLVRGVGLVTTWDQNQLQLYAAGDSRIIHIWDVNSQLKVQELSTGADSCVTSLLLLQESGILVAGCGDGSVRMFDARIRNPDCRVRSVRAHESWVVNTLAINREETHFLTASENGDIKMWNVYDTNPVHGIRIIDKIRSISAHPQLSLIACGTANHSVHFCNLEGEEIGLVKYYDGFLGQRIGFMTCMQFHPTMAHLAVGTADSFLTIYSGDSTLQAI